MHLFDRIPSSIFAVMNGTNGRRTWDLVTTLVAEFFGPDRAPDHPDGYLHDQVTKAIERFLVGHAFDQDEFVSPLTPINVQAHSIFRRLVDTGWFTDDQVGGKKFVSMQPPVHRLFETLQAYAQEGPQHIGGNIQVIFNNMKAVVLDPRGQAAAFNATAQLVGRLINSLNSTTMRTRDLMRELVCEAEVSNFVRRFFEEHISKTYIQDFKDLRTANHPLSLRLKILEMVNAITTEDEPRKLLVEGYRAMNPTEEPEAAIDRDVQRFEKLMDVERFLERMDFVMDNATTRAIAFIDYRLKSTARIEVAITSSIESILAADAAGLPIEGRLLRAPPLFSEEGLALPAPPPEKPRPRAMVKRELTPRERAYSMLRKAMMMRRDMSAPAITRFVAEKVASGATCTSEDFPIERIEDAIALVGLMRLASMNRGNAGFMRSHPVFRKADFKVELVPGERFGNEFFDMPKIRVIRRAATQKES